VAVSLGEVTRRLRELIVALDRRAPRTDRAAEVTIALDSAALREKAVSRLAELAEQTIPTPDAR
jgi:hypothetical protein